MIGDDKWFDKLDLLNETAMGYEVGVTPLFEADYLKEFYDFFEIKDRSPRLIQSEDDFAESLRNLSGEYRWEASAEKTEELFGLPYRITFFDDITGLKEELGGPNGLSSFFFVFDIMFCEYEGFTLCFICGTNN